MPNWCFINYKVVGKKEAAKRFTDMLDHLKSLPEPFVENGFWGGGEGKKGNNLWLGCIVNYLGGDWNAVHCRGVIDSYNLVDGRTADEGIVDVQLEHAWDEPSEFRKFLLEKYPDIRIVYRAEEGGNVLYKTNDATGEFFPEKYILQYEDEDGNCDTEYFVTLQTLAEYIQDNGLAEKVEPDFGKITDALDKWEEEDDNRWYSVNEYDIA